MTRRQNLIGGLNQAITPYPTFMDAVEYIENVLDLKQNDGVVRHVMLLGDSGTGKSTLCKLLVKRHPRIAEEERDLIPILHVTVPAGATTGQLVNSILCELTQGDRVTGLVDEKTRRAESYIKGCGVQMILIDEAQHLVDRGGDKSRYKVGDWLKVFMENIQVPVIMVGLPRAEDLRNTNVQLRRRLGATLSLNLSEGRKPIEEECLNIFNALLSELPFRLVHGFEPREFAVRLRYATDGRVAYIKLLLEFVVSILERMEDKKITPFILGEAFRQGIWHSVSEQLNPFSEKFCFRDLTQRGEPFRKDFANGSTTKRSEA